MHIPRVLKIKRSKWRIIIDKDAFDSKKLNGLCVFRTRQIFLDSSLPSNELEITWLHEYLHALFPAGVISGRKEEEIVDKLSKALHKNLKDNNLTISRNHKRSR